MLWLVWLVIIFVGCSVAMLIAVLSAEFIDHHREDAEARAVAKHFQRREAIMDERSCLNPRYWTCHTDAEVVELSADWRDFADLMEAGGHDKRRFMNIRHLSAHYGALAEQDLQQRGPGELSGRKQWGISDIGMEALKNMKLEEKESDR